MRVVGLKSSKVNLLTPLSWRPQSALKRLRYSTVEVPVGRSRFESIFGGCEMSMAKISRQFFAIYIHTHDNSYITPVCWWLNQ